MLPASPMSGVLHRVDQLFREEMAMRRRIEEFSLSPPNCKDKNNKTDNSTNTNNSNTESSNKTRQINITNNAVTGDVYLSVPAQGTTKYETSPFPPSLPLPPLPLFSPFIFPSSSRSPFNVSLQSNVESHEIAGSEQLQV